MGCNYDEPWSKYWSHCNTDFVRNMLCLNAAAAAAAHAAAAHAADCMMTMLKMLIKVLQKLKHFTIVFLGRLTRLHSPTGQSAFDSTRYLSAVVIYWPGIIQKLSGQLS